MSALTFVDVFVDEGGNVGNPVAIRTDATAVSDEEALAVAGRTGTSETVFIDDAATGTVRIFVPTRRVPFAGHPLIGTGWFLHHRGHPVEALRTDAGVVPVSVEGSTCSVLVPAGLGVPWNLNHVEDADAVLTASGAGRDRHDYVWAWIDAARGLVRARAFTSASGTTEDEATGSAALELCAALGRPLTIIQGQGSVLEVCPEGDRIRLTGRVRRGSTLVPGEHLPGGRR